MNHTDILVIGAGLAGLTLARRLAETTTTVVVIEKSGSPGGRLATRHSRHGDIDHGAQYITSRTPEFTSLVNQLAQSGEMAAWKPDGKDSAKPWWVGKPGMSTIGKSLSRGLDVRFGARAMRVLEHRDGYAVMTENDDGTETAWSAARIVAAIPAPQAHALLSPLDPAFALLEKVSMAPCWAILLGFKARLETVPDLARGQPDDVLSLMTRNGSKPGRSGETFVLHANPDWSRANLRTRRETVARDMLDAMRIQTGLGADLPEPVHLDLHRWLYALAERPLDAPFIGNAGNTLFACGDWCIDARAEAAHQSGLALADHIISL